MKNTLLPVLLIVASCNNQASDSDYASSDSTKAAPPAYLKDPTASYSGEGPNPTEVINETIKGYQDKLNLDSSFILGKDTLFLSVKYYCTMDSAIVIPAMFLEPYRIDSFVTHNKNLEISVRKNGRETLNKLIDKSDFDEQILNDNLRNYGVIQKPSVRTDKKKINIGFRFSIPLTDLGIDVEMSIDSKGELHW